LLSRNLMNEEDIARSEPQHQKKKKATGKVSSKSVGDV